MRIPGSNLLNMAMSVIAKETIVYLAYTGRDSNTIGMYEDSYAAPVTITGSVQPVSRKLYAQMGLDFQKNYHTFYVPQFVGDVARMRAGDKFTFNGTTWQTISTTPWFQMDGWTECLCVQIPNPNTNYINVAGFTYGTEDGTQLYIQE